MILGGGVFGLVLLALWLFCIVDVVTARADTVRTLPKWVWLLIVVLLVDVGALLWLLAGRDWSAHRLDADRSDADRSNTHRPATRRAPRPRGRARATRVVGPDDDAEFLASIDTRPPGEVDGSSGPPAQ